MGEVLGSIPNSSSKFFFGISIETHEVIISHYELCVVFSANFCPAEELEKISREQLQSSEVNDFL